MTKKIDISAEVALAQCRREVGGPGFVFHDLGGIVIKCGDVDHDAAMTMDASTLTRNLRPLIQALEPVKLYERSQAREYTSATPLNRPVDAARPESEIARGFAALPSFDAWVRQYAQLREAFANSFLLKQIEPVSADVSALARTASEARRS